MQSNRLTSENIIRIQSICNFRSSWILTLPEMKDENVYMYIKRFSDLDKENMNVGCNILEGVAEVKFLRWYWTRSFKGSTVPKIALFTNELNLEFFFPVKQIFKNLGYHLQCHWLICQWALYLKIAHYVVSYKQTFSWGLNGIDSKVTSFLL